MNANPQRVEHQMTDKGYVPVYTTTVVEQPWASYTPTDHHTWAVLFARQQALLPQRASQTFLDNLARMDVRSDAIPRFDEVNAILRRATGWEIVGVEGLLPELTFFDHLAHRRFPVTWWIRKPEQIDYLSEPDLFHDLFGHVPLLLEPAFADYMQAYGQGGLRAHAFGPETLAQLTRLYWYTVEFGLIREPSGLRIYGAGIVSSKGESIHCLESSAPNRIGFDLRRVMRTRYRIDTYQKTYFVIDGYQQLMEATAVDFAPIYGELAESESIPAGQVLASDTVMNRGTGEGWATDGDI
ncbi:MAG: phenylalanine 4-monooxygenase [Proteobacteria bacterium]|nr:phenylalanine 4-monooxygenase [Pseudomonadota bacterium]